MPELRFDPLRKEWVAYATERNDRTFLPTDFCPLCPSGKGGASEVPLDTFEVVVFENRFPAFGPDRLDGRPVRPSTTGCEVIVYTPEHLENDGQCLHCSELAAEAPGPRLVLGGGTTTAFVPRSARWPYEVHLYPR